MFQLELAAAGTASAARLTGSVAAAAAPAPPPGKAAFVNAAGAKPATKGTPKAEAGKARRDKAPPPPPPPRVIFYNTPEYSKPPPDKPVPKWGTFRAEVLAGVRQMRVPGTFLGTSHEWTRMADYANNIEGFRNVFREFGPSPIIRLGGASQDKMSEMPEPAIWCAPRDLVWVFGRGRGRRARVGPCGGAAPASGRRRRVDVEERARGRCGARKRASAPARTLTWARTIPYAGRRS